MRASLLCCLQMQKTKEATARARSEQKRADALQEELDKLRQKSISMDVDDEEEYDEAKKRAHAPVGAGLEGKALANEVQRRAHKGG